MRTIQCVVFGALALQLTAATGRLRAQDAATAPSAPMPSVKLPRALDRVLRDYERAWRARDAAGLAALFARNGFVLQNGTPPVRGRSQVQRAYTGAGGPLALRALAYATADTVGWIIGAYGGEAGSADDGKFVLALRRARGGAWEIAADMDNGNSRGRPAPGADSLVLERTRCYGFCPAYRLSITQAGHIAFVSHNPGDSTRATADTTAAAFALLARRVAEGNLFALPERIGDAPVKCSAEASDAPTAIVTIHRGATAKRIEDYHGCRIADNHPLVKAVQALRDLETAIDSTANSARWVRPASRRD